MKDINWKSLTIETLEQMVEYYISDELESEGIKFRDIKVGAITMKLNSLEVSFLTLCPMCMDWESHRSIYIDIDLLVDKYIVKARDVAAYKEAAKKIEELGDCNE